MEEFRGSFVAYGDDGEEYVVEIYVDVRNVGSFDDPHATRDGLKSLRTEHGYAVKYKVKGEYEIVHSGVRLRSDSPDAP